MKKIKLFIIALILIGTALAILYLTYVAKQMEKYTISRNDGGTCFIVFSSSSGKLSDGKNTLDILKTVEKNLKAAGYDVIRISESGKNTDNFKDVLQDNMKQNKKYVFLDVNSTKLLVNTNSIILRVGDNKNEKYAENLEYAKTIKENTKGLKINILSDVRDNYYQDMAYKAVRIEISENTDFEKAENCLLKLLKPIIQ